MSESKKKRKLSFNTLLLVLSILVIACIMTYIIPAGQFDMDPETKALIAGTYHRIAQTPVNLWQTLLNIHPGLISSPNVICHVLFTAGILRIIISTGAVDDFLNWSIYKLQRRGVMIIVPMMVILFAILCAYGGNDSFFVFTIIGIAVAKKLKLDPIAGIAMTYFATSIGFAGAIKGRTIIAQGLADLPLYSGAAQRTFWLFFMTACGVAYALWYCLRVKKDPKNSFMGSSEWLAASDADAVAIEAVPFKIESLLVILITAGSFVFNAVMSITQSWSYPQYTAVLFCAGIVCGALYRKTPVQMAEEFAKGCQSMGFVVIIIGLGGAIARTLQQGNVLHTIVNWVTAPLAHAPAGVGSIVMFWFNWLFNFFIISGSGQAAIVMPVMTPIADLLGIHRQVAVSAFVYGDAFTNMLFPTSAQLMGALAIAGVPLGKWVKFAQPFLLILSVFTSIYLYILTASGWTGM